MQLNNSFQFKKYISTSRIVFDGYNYPREDYLDKKESEDVVQQDRLIFETKEQEQRLVKEEIVQEIRILGEETTIEERIFEETRIENERLKAEEKRQFEEIIMHEIIEKERLEREEIMRQKTPNELLGTDAIVLEEDEEEKQKRKIKERLEKLRERKKWFLISILIQACVYGPFFFYYVYLDQNIEVQSKRIE